MFGSKLVELYRRMVRIRRFEQAAAELYAGGKIPGFVHVSVGQEATAVGGCWPLASSDRISSTHRGHGHCLAKGMAMEPMFAELFGRATGVCRGLGGSMHIADPALGMLGANGIVGAGLPIATGSATASQLRGDGAVTVAFFGDGAVATGAFHESVNLAALWSLPMIFLCENNGYAEFSATADQHRVPVVKRADAYGIEGHAVDGSDVVAVAALMGALVGRVRAGDGPFLVEAVTQRWHGHYEGDPQRYRAEGEFADGKRIDPLLRARDAIVAAGGSVDEMDAVDAAVAAEVAGAIAAAKTAPDAEPVADLLIAPRGGQGVDDSPSAAEDAPPWKMMDAVHDAIEHELEDDPSVFVAGIDVGAGGNVFALTRGLWDRWPDRVRDTPISETAIVGVAVGAAMVGMRPIVEVMYLDFIGACFDQLLNQAAKLRFMSGGAVTLPLVVRTQFGSGRSSGSQHSQSLEALLAHIPGLTVVMPSTAADAYGLLRSAVRDPNPVVVIENRMLYGRKEPRVERDHRVPIGKGAVVRAGRHVTIVTMSRMVHESLAAAAELGREGIDAEVIDLRTIAPLDWPLVRRSIEKTGRLLIAHDAVTDFGVGAEIAARAADDGFWSLDAPVRRVGAPFTPAPYAPALERDWVPGAPRIVAAVRDLLAV